MIKIITDSTAVMSQADIKKYDLEIARLNVLIGDESLKDGEKTLTEVFELMDNGVKVSTSQPSPDEFVSVYNKQIEKGATTILCITVSKGLSGTLQSATIAADIVMEDNPKVKIVALSSGSASIGEESVVRAVCRMVEEEKDSEVAIERAKNICKNGNTLLTIDDLNTVVKTGRMKKSKAIIGNLLRVKPILEMINEEIEITQKVRKTSKAIEKYAEIVSERVAKYPITEIRVAHIQKEDVGLKLIEAIKAKVPANVDVAMAEEIGVVLAVHLGRGGFGVGFTYESER